jgi:hypothetical protein
MNTLVARIATSGGGIPPLDGMNTFIKMMFKGSPKLEEKSKGLAGLVTTFGEFELALSAIPEPIPFDDISGPCARSWMWPEASEAIKASAGHLVVTCRAEEPVSGAIALTKVVAAALDGVPGIGVHFGDAGTVNSADQFFSIGRGVKPGALPLYLWLGIHAFKEDDGTSTVYTTGMGAFGLPEFQAVRSSLDLQTVADTLYSVVHHRLDGAAIADGDSIDLGDGLSVAIANGPGRFNTEADTMLLSFVEAQ